MPTRKASGKNLPPYCPNFTVKSFLHQLPQLKEIFDMHDWILQMEELLQYNSLNNQIYNETEQWLTFLAAQSTPTMGAATTQQWSNDVLRV